MSLPFPHKYTNELSYRSTIPRPSSLKPSLLSIWPRCLFKPHCSLRYCKISILYIEFPKCSSHHLNWTMNIIFASLQCSLRYMYDLELKSKQSCSSLHITTSLKICYFFNFSFRWATVFHQPLTSRWSNITSSFVFSFPVLKFSYTLSWILWDCKMFIIHVTFFF